MGAHLKGGTQRGGAHLKGGTESGGGTLEGLSLIHI